ncbi:hypothetical protein G7K_5647-t1 [Saitoella complicata NRRL Y-17804]|uniref:Uncharacterized protein n=1 Tax=Saitoella complicata (strain BCRC 22490 / CBS 7301 / JCM 7358 / NBRC 10748 / NRRL Y-17804) TaxID=698492 RepID=A0A0E9NP17_SAICN|nr:hypothetical protein G7K_5647-t1 [Saitoella complicata NRRL Y-17804]
MRSRLVRWMRRQNIADGWIRQCWQPWKEFVATNDEHRNAWRELNSFLNTLRLEHIQHDCSTDTGVFFRGDLVIYHPSHSLNEHVCRTFVLNDDEKKGIAHINEVAFQEAFGYPWALQETDSMIEVGYFEVIGKALQVIMTYACDENKLDLVKEHFDKWRRVWSECGTHLTLECRRL